MHVQASLRESNTTRTFTILGAPEMKSASGSYRLLPRIMEVTYSESFAPDAETRTDVKVSGPVLLDDESVSVSWTSRRFLGDLGIDSGPAWIRQFVENFRPHDISSLGTDTLRGDPSEWG